MPVLYQFRQAGGRNMELKTFDSILIVSIFIPFYLELTKQKPKRLFQSTMSIIIAYVVLLALIFSFGLCFNVESSILDLLFPKRGPIPPPPPSTPTPTIQSATSPDSPNEKDFIAGGSGVSYIISDGQQIKSIESHYIANLDLIEINIEWENNAKICDSLIAQYGNYLFTKDEVDNAISIYPPMWQEQVRLQTKLQSFAGVSFTRGDLVGEPIYVLILSVDHDANVVAYTIVKLEDIDP